MPKYWVRGSMGLLLLLFLGPGVRADESMPKDMKQYYFGLIHRGATWTAEKSVETEAIQQAHLANIRRLARAGKLVLAGPFGDEGELRGIFIYSASSLEEAETLVASDPAVKAGRLRVELHPWWGPIALDTLYASSSAKQTSEPTGAK